MPGRVVSLLAAIALAACFAVAGDVVAEELTTASLQAQLEAQSREIAELRARLDKQESLLEAPSTASSEPGCDAPLPVHRLPVVVDETVEPSCLVEEGPSTFSLDYYTDYDKGFVLARPIAPKKHPYEIKLNGWIQFRHHAFSRNVETWTDNAGVTRDVLDRNALDIERARLVLSGYVQDPRLTYFVQLDGDTDGGHAVDFFDYWWAWKFSDRFELQMGKRKVTASRQWLLGARDTRLVDRPLANDFFRPDRTVGLFGLGRLGDTGRYEVMVGNGYNSSNLPNSASDNRLTFAASTHFEPLGDFGRGIVDFSGDSELRLQLGHSFIYSPQASSSGGAPLDEADYLRLTDGTRLTDIGALAAGVTVSDFDVYFYGVDAAMKWRGWSLNSEVFFRWIEQIHGDGALPVSDLFQRGFYVEGGKFLIPETLDINARYSQINGLYGDASEYAAGLNWYPLHKTTMKVSFDVTALDGSPLQNTTSDILVGDDGVLFRTQFQAEF